MSLVSSPVAASTAVLFRGVKRYFGTVKAVDGVDLDVVAGEFFAMLGPSGSGKTTCLRLVAGFDQPTEGHIEIFGEAVEGVPAYRRPVNTVFQDYALFPHMTVLENVCYGLMIRGMGQAERQLLGVEALSLVKLVGMEFEGQASFPAASASVWRWPGRWSCARRSCYSTSRSGPST